MVGRLRGLLYKFYELRNILTSKNLRLLYNALAESLIRYCILIYGGLFQDSLKQLCVMQNTVLKILFKKEKRHSTRLLYSDLKIMNIRQLYSYRCLLWMFVNRQGSTLIPSREHTRYWGHVEIPLFRKTHLQRFVFFHGPKLYNLLPPEIKRLSNFKKYKKEIINFVLSNYNRINDLFTARY